MFIVKPKRDGPSYRKKTVFGDYPIRRYKRGKTQCSRCERPRAKGSRYCREHVNLYRRLTRPKHGELSAEDRARANARSYANVYQRRGKLQPQPCKRCGAAKAEKHHKDYSKPLEVEWLCRKCHLAEHRED